MRRIPIGGAGWLVIAAAAAPIVLKACKPLAKKLGEAMEDLGQKLQAEAKEDVANKHKAAERPEDPTGEAKPDGAATDGEAATKATRVRQTQPKAKSPIKPKPKRTVKSSPAKPRPRNKPKSEPEG